MIDGCNGLHGNCNGNSEVTQRTRGWGTIFHFITKTKGFLPEDESFEHILNCIYCYKQQSQALFFSLYSGTCDCPQVAYHVVRITVSFFSPPTFERPSSHCTIAPCLAFGEFSCCTARVRDHSCLLQLQPPAAKTKAARSSHNLDLAQKTLSSGTFILEQVARGRRSRWWIFFPRSHTSLWTKLLLRDRAGLLMTQLSKPGDVCPLQPLALQPPVDPVSPLCPSGKGSFHLS